MFFPNRLSRMAVACSAVALAGTVVLMSVAPAQVGPQPPQPKPAQENGVSKMLGKFIKGKQSNPDEDADGEDQGPQPALRKPAASGPSLSGPPSLQSGPTHEPLLSQPPLTNVKIEEPEVDGVNPPILSHPKLDDPTNPLGFADAEIKLKRYIGLNDAKRFQEARLGLMPLRQWLIDLTEAHIGLYKTLNQIPSAKGQAELEKELALQFAQLRDRAMMEMARVYIADKDYGKAVKELAEVVKSQPKSRVGLRSYEMLQEIGFTEKLQLAQ
ncbi:hypothetical protein [Vampirovibrio sp.]|uniref:hypothetical protein n=1 Tax=Vampirovibrio sp. TaxID=2717857 RepID=UPI0035934FB8